MKYKILIAAVLLGSVLTGCKAAAGQGVDVQSQVIETQIQTAETPSQEQLPLWEAETPSQEQTQPQAAASSFSFSEVENREFYFSSGAGAWYTVLTIHGDGTFEGHYQDADMGDTGEDYPNGTLYYSDFYGTFTDPEQVNDTTYRFRIHSLEYPLGMGQEIKDGILYQYTTAYGLEDGEDFYMYRPEADKSQLPEPFLQWTRDYHEDSASGEELSFYGIYNEKAQVGFSSYEVSDTWMRIQEILADAERRAEELETSMQDENASQADMNQISGEIYKVWDDTLNTIWSILKEVLDEERMAELTIAEREWIAVKEAAVSEAGAAYEGGSIRPLVCNREAARLTRERAYVLGDMIK